MVIELPQELWSSRANWGRRGPPPRRPAPASPLSIAATWEPWVDLVAAGRELPASPTALAIRLADARSSPPAVR